MASSMPKEDGVESILDPGQLTINGSVIPVHDWLDGERARAIVSIN